VNKLRFCLALGSDEAEKMGLLYEPALVGRGCMMKINQVEVFAEKPFLGNPAGACILNEELDEKLMQNIPENSSL
jgi:hypothetical protein